MTLEAVTGVLKSNSEASADAHVSQGRRQAEETWEKSGEESSWSVCMGAKGKRRIRDERERK